MKMKPFAAGLGLMLAAYASGSHAAMVYGRIIGADEQFPPNGTCVFRNDAGQAITVRADESGRYSVYLEPGKYDVICQDHWSGTVYSAESPVRQDIHLSD